MLPVVPEELIDVISNGSPAIFDVRVRDSEVVAAPVIKFDRVEFDVIKLRIASLMFDLDWMKIRPQLLPCK